MRVSGKPRCWHDARLPIVASEENTMSLTFYYGSGSPFAWRVWLALEHKKIPYEMKTISFSSGELKTPEFLALNPRHKVPVVVDDGFALYESTAIVEYLEEKFSTGAPLLPSSPSQRALVRRMMQEADLYVNTAMNPLTWQIFFKPKEEWDLEKIEQAAKGLKEELAVWEKADIGSFLVGSSLSAADFTLYPMLALALRLEKKKADLGVRYMIGPKLATWMQNMTEQPVVRATWPPHWK
ncbi:MAG: glutathione S-transferase family protein [Betaproteobacteria bacterium]|nr:glutathione S-transferase family protein [Betaproteobacteria bacterium]